MEIPKGFLYAYKMNASTYPSFQLTEQETLWLNNKTKPKNNRQRTLFLDSVQVVTKIFPATLDFDYNTYTENVPILLFFSSQK